MRKIIIMEHSCHCSLLGIFNQGYQHSVDVLTSLVYAAARIGVGEFIRMVFSTSAGRIVFEAYKNKSPLPENIADANGHDEIAASLRAITKRYLSLFRQVCEFESKVENRYKVSWVSTNICVIRNTSELSNVSRK